MLVLLEIGNQQQMIGTGQQNCNADLYVGAAYDVSRRETFDSIGEIWMKEVEMYSTVSGAVKAIIGNKMDLVSRLSFSCELSTGSSDMDKCSPSELCSTPQEYSQLRVSSF